MSEETQKPKQPDVEESDENSSGGDRSPVTTDRDLSNNQAPTGERETDPKRPEGERGSAVTESSATVDRGAEDSEKPIAPEDQPEEKIDNDSND